jgi:tyrosinase
MLSRSLATLLATSLALLSGVSGSPVSHWDGCGENLSCAEGYMCETTEKGGYSRCVKEGSITPFDHKEEAHKLFVRQSTSTPITGPVNAGIVNRMPIQVLQTSEPDTFNILMWAWYVIENVAETNSLSYYQMSGIHGRPFIPWQEPSSPSQDTSTGYCTHDSALFATWHRPYLSLIEQRLTAHALNEAGKFSSDVRTRWQNAARRVRLPYWDWSSSDLRSSIPAIIRTPKIFVTRPGTNGVPTRVEIPNPLYQYRFTNTDLKNQHFEGFWRTAAATRRHPPPSGTSSDNNAADLEMRNTYQSRRQNTYNLFSIPSFREFSNTAFSAGGQPNSWTSIESIHNEIHVNIGGDLGHMTLVDYSAFDPIFWLHHCNVDRLVAMYQAVYPGRVVTPQPASGTFARRVSPGDQDTIDTPLYPFRKSNGALFTSRDVSSAASIWQYGYAYPEVPSSFQGRPASELSTFTRGRVNALYGPNTVSSSASVAKRQAGGKKREWICHIVFAPAEVSGTAEVLVFLGNITASNPSDRKKEENLVGTGASFGKQNAMTDTNRKITAAVPLTKALEDNNVDPNDVKASVKFLAENLRWTMQKGESPIPIEDVSTLRVGVSSAEVTPGQGDELPKWGEFETYYECTNKKKGGLTLVDSNIVDSKDKPKVLADAGIKVPVISDMAKEGEKVDAAPAESAKKPASSATSEPAAEPSSTSESAPAGAAASAVASPSEDGADAAATPAEG